MEIQLINSLNRGEPSALGDIYNELSEAVRKNILHIIHRDDIADDILHDVFLKLWNNRNKFEDYNSIKSWLFRVSYNAAMDYLREKVKEKQHLESASHEKDIFYDECAESNEIKHRLMQEAIHLLPTKKRQVMELCKMNNKTYAEAASILGVSSYTVKEYVADSLKIIRSYVNKQSLTALLIAAFCIS